MVGMLWVLYSLHHHVVARNTPAVFRWRSMLPCDADWVTYAFLWLQYLLDQYVMLPAIAKIVLVDDARLLARSNLTQRSRPFTLRVGHEIFVHTVAFVSYDELVHVVVLPVHDNLKVVVQLLKGGVTGEQNSSPDWGVAA